ncbi:factor in the germline alpha [Vidua macroura]|uniref:factor in the germline alpha n=1 Tax=Vidua macroura TaxID=187451 RepID=UPI0023A7D014|nr:factor in the germline alpha [Vidua macroura]
MGEPSRAGVWPEALEPSGVPEPSRGPDPLGVTEPSGVPKPLEVLGAPEPPGVPQPSGVPGVLQPTPPPEVLEGLLSQRFGPLPQPATIARLRRGPAGGYEPTGDPVEVLERRQAANAKERERIRNLNSGFSQLRTLVPLVPRDRRPSKADTLRAAAQYIRLLRGVLRDCQVFPDAPRSPVGGLEGGDLPQRPSSRLQPPFLGSRSCPGTLHPMKPSPQNWGGAGGLPPLKRRGWGGQSCN